MHTTVDRWVVFEGWEKVFDSLVTMAAGFLLCPRCAHHENNKCRLKITPYDEMCPHREEYMDAWLNVVEGLEVLTWAPDEPGGPEG